MIVGINDMNWISIKDWLPEDYQDAGVFYPLVYYPIVTPARGTAKEVVMDWNKMTPCAYEHIFYWTSGNTGGEPPEDLCCQCGQIKYSDLKPSDTRMRLYDMF